MDDEKGDGLQVCLNDQSLYPLFKIMEAEIFNILLGQNCVRLFFENRDPLRQGIIIVLIFNDIIIPQLVGNGLRLTEMTAAIRAGIDFNQGDDVGIDGADEADYPLQVDAGSLKKTGKRQWQMVAKFMAGTISDIIKK